MHFLRYTMSLVFLLSVGCDAISDITDGVYNGEWEGEGSINKLVDGKSIKDKATECPLVTYSFKADASELTIYKRQFRCLGSTETFSNLSLKLVGNGIYYLNEQIGKIDNKSFEFTLVNSSGNRLLFSAFVSSDYLVIQENHELGRQETHTFSKLYKVDKNKD